MCPPIRFCANSSIIHSIINLINQYAEVNSSKPKQHTRSIFYNLSNAFDVIKPKMILNKLKFMEFAE